MERRENRDGRIEASFHRITTWWIFGRDCLRYFGLPYSYPDSKADSNVIFQGWDVDEDPLAPFLGKSLLSIRLKSLVPEQLVWRWWIRWCLFHRHHSITLFALSALFFRDAFSMLILRIDLLLPRICRCISSSSFCLMMMSSSFSC